jgi:hypothetical protein
MSRMLTQMLGAMAVDAGARGFHERESGLLVPERDSLSHNAGDADPLEHNAGACGCGSGGLAPSGGCCSVCGPGGTPMSGGGASAARLLMGLWPSAAAMIANVQTGIGARGDGGGAVSADEVAKSVAARGDAARGGCVPYMNAVRDCLCMVELPSQRIAAPASGAVTLTIAPQSGWFFAFYMDVNVNRPGVAPANPVVPPGEYLVERPRVRGCPPSPCIPPPTTGTAQTIPMAGNFLAAPQTCSGCGRPFIAVIPNLSNGTPLEVNISGLAQNDVAQAVVRGFCFDTRICC